ncbi:MAG TPA: ATP synthase subunit I [Steroidobacteraceae bacterium]|nr:ATP synthase subunit I [Steroidobacteraceae bacterium]
MAVTIELPDVRRLALRFVRAQALVTLLAAAACLALAGPRAAISALLGGGVSTAGSLAMALVAFRRDAPPNAVSMLAGLLVGEAAKLLVVVMLFVLVLTLMKVAPVPMLSAYVATFLVYWWVFTGERRASGGALSGREMR